jgi:small subunit ribosomal protein S20
MPHTDSARKRHRQDQRREQANKARRSSLKTHERRLLSLIAAGDKQAATALLPEVYQQLDKAALRHIVHRNTAANHKSRLARLVAKM